MKFGKWSPDQPHYGHDGLVICRNVYPSAGGYRPFKDLTRATGQLAATWQGSGAFEHNGTSVMLAATPAGIYSHSAGVWTEEHAVVTTQRWFFTQFGDLVVGTHGAAPVKYSLSGGTGASLGGSPPSASYSAVSKGFLGLAGNASDGATFSWSGLEAPETWTIGTNQCDEQSIPDGGPITGLAGGESFIIFQRSAITLAEYVGLPFVFAFRKVSDAIGCVHHGSIAHVGDTTYFLSTQGFKALRAGQVFDIGEPDEAGQGGVNDTFLETYTTSEIEAGINCAVDEERRLIIWSMPGRLWVYHIPSGRWSDVLNIAILGVSHGMRAAATLEGIAVTFPSIEDVTPDLDDAYWRAGERLLLIADVSGYLNTLASTTSLEARFESALIEIFPGRAANIRTVRPISDATLVQVSVDMRRTLSVPLNRAISSDMRSNGDVSIRPVSGRYAQFTFLFGGRDGEGGTYYQGFDVEASPGGSM